ARGHDARPGALEGRPRHDGVLHGEEPEQGDVDGDRRPRQVGTWRGERDGDEVTGHEPHGVEERAEEGQVGQNTVEETEPAGHGYDSFSAARLERPHGARVSRRSGAPARVGPGNSASPYHHRSGGRGAGRNSGLPRPGGGGGRG